MAAKCALVVDDSKSARAFLSRILEKHDLQVDSAESAEEALDYLTRHRPDVIFMDHLMPGMDGFQAVQAIKNNPRTATIPILMYTSQEGELYLGQARALGALGVLPKQIRPADVTQVLGQLHLFERRQPAPEATEAEADAGPKDPTHVSRAIATGTLPLPVIPPELQQAAGVADAPAAPAAATPAPPARYAFGAPVEQLLRDQIAEVRRTLVSRLDELQDGLPSQLHEAVRAHAPPPPPPVAYPLPPPDRRGWLAAAGLAALALLFAVLWAREAGQRAATERSLAALVEEQRQVLAVAAVAPVPAPAAEPAEAPVVAPAPRRVLPAAPPPLAVPYGETPLAGDRVAAIRGVLEDLRRGAFRGDVELLVNAGRFCLVGNAGEGYSLAPDELAHARCDRVGNPAQDGGATRESPAFANMIAEQRKAAGNAMAIRVVDGPDRPAQAYPEPGAAVTAGAWNAAATANNRVEVRWRERP